MKFVIGEISKLKYEIQTDKSLEEFKGKSEDGEFYNQYLKEQRCERDGNVTFFNSIWLHAECYVYRKIWEIFDST